MRRALRMPGTSRRAVVLAALVVAVLAGCRDRAAVPASSSTAPPAATGTATSVAPAATTPGAEQAPLLRPGMIRLTPALGGHRFERPVEWLPLDDATVVAEQDGAVRAFHADGTGDRLVLDLRGAVLRQGNEEGLLSVALDPGYPARPYLYAYYSAPNPRRTVLSRFTLAGGVADRASELVILEVPQPFPNHNGGAIRFGPDRMLYLGLGDGGGAGDPQHNGQNPHTLLGSLLRIDVTRAAPGAPYAIPADNPFADGRAGRPEIWAYGLRNPWRTAFDPATGALWAGDVGQDEVEEVDVITRGGNYGWNMLEGSTCYRAGSCDRTATIAPVAEYRHTQGCSITGGVVYRGRAIPQLRGAYLYADFCSGRLWALPVPLNSNRGFTGGDPVELLRTGLSIASFGVDAAGEVYVLAFGQPVQRIVAAE